MKYALPKNNVPALYFLNPPDRDQIVASFLAEGIMIGCTDQKQFQQTNKYLLFVFIFGEVGKESYKMQAGSNFGSRR